MDFDNMIGRVLESVELSPDKTRVAFSFAGGFRRQFGVEGGCCSSSWIEHLESIRDIDGATLLRVEEGGRAPTEKESAEYEWETLQVYLTRFITDRGEIVLEYRNSSNGYYGGYLVDTDEARS